MHAYSYFRKRYISILGPALSEIVIAIAIYVTRFAKRGLIHTSDFATLMRHNFICGSAMKLKFTVSLV